mmetsp:Transcript_24808/g.83379  ORF Transcript_24808/g.83379 Transcript_24808/m.83379 type:complete len:209 (+) Transcript_24808:1493-2119(+)
MSSSNDFCFSRTRRSSSVGGSPDAGAPNAAAGGGGAARWTDEMWRAARWCESKCAKCVWFCSNWPDCCGRHISARAWRMGAPASSRNPKFKSMSCTVMCCSCSRPPGGPLRAEDAAGALEAAAGALFGNPGGGKPGGDGRGNGRGGGAARLAGATNAGCGSGAKDAGEAGQDAGSAGNPAGSANDVGAANAAAPSKAPASSKAPKAAS